MKYLALAGMVLCSFRGDLAQAQAVHGPRVELLLGLEARSAGGGIKQDSRPIFGARAGYDLPVARRLSLGIDAEVSGFGHDGDDRFAAPTFLTFPPITDTEFDYRTQVGRALYIGGRTTYAVTDAIGIFGAVGYSNQRVSACLFRVIAGDCPSPTVTVGAGARLLSPAPALLPHDVNGIRFSGGVTVALTRHFFTTVEYRHASYGDASVGGLIIAAQHFLPVVVQPEFGHTDQVAGAIGWRF